MPGAENQEKLKDTQHEEGLGSISTGAWDGSTAGVLNKEAEWSV